MPNIRGTLHLLPRRHFSRTALALSSIKVYKAPNEPILSYNKGSKEREELQKKLKEYEGKVFEVPIIIGDEEIRTDRVFHQVRPFDHQTKLAKSYKADVKSIEKAIDVSCKARDAWERTSLEKRSEIFLRAADLISGKYRMEMNASTMLGQGKTVIQAEIDAACELADFYRFNVQFAQEIERWAPISTEAAHNRQIYRGLEGFWATVAPFNFTAISGNITGTPVFMGNVVLWKPPNTALLSSYTVFKILREAGVPPGVVNFLPSDGSQFGDVILKSPHLAGVNFTGSAQSFHNIWTGTAKNVHAHRNFPRLIGECGGKNFHLVHTSADERNVVNCTIRSAFEYGGQKCSACSRLYVPKSKWNSIRQGLLKAVGEMKVGSPLELDTFFSAVIDEKAFKSIKSYLDFAKTSSDLKILVGGSCDSTKGYFIQPTVIETTNPRNKLMEEEIFGPVLTVFVYDDSDYGGILKLIDSTSAYGLTGAIFASDEKAINEAMGMLRYSAGNLYVNDKSSGAVVGQQPFGGARKSGTNDKAGGPHYILRFVSPQAIKTGKAPLADWRYTYMKE